MEYKIGEREYEFNCKLRTCLKIKNKFNKNYMEIINEIDKMDVNELINLLYCGLDKEKVDEKEFRDYVLDTCGMAELYDHVTWFVMQLQYPGLSEDEIEKKLLEKKLKQKKLQDQM